MRPAIERLEGKQVRYVDGRVDDVDVIVYATGYNISFPFFVENTLKPDEDNRYPLFKRMMRPDAPNLFFMGLAQPLPTLVNFAEQQAKLVAAYLTGKYRPPPPDEMQRITEKDEAYYLGPYYKAARHTIQVDFAHYCRDLHREIAKGAARARAAGNALPVEARAA
jgi:NADH dehydrogenase FAD-containing subunit